MLVHLIGDDVYQHQIVANTFLGDFISSIIKRAIALEHFDAVTRVSSSNLAGRKKQQGTEITMNGWKLAHFIIRYWNWAPPDVN